MMMTNMQVAIGILWKSILLNSLFIGAWAVFEWGLKVVGLMMLLVIAGFIVTMPILPLISFLLKLHRLIPYNNKARYTWFNCMMILIVWIFYTAIAFIKSGAWLPDDIIYYQAVITTSLAFLAGTALTKTEINRLSIPSKKPQLII